MWAATWQNQQSEYAPSEDSDQPGHPPSLIRVFAVRMKKPWVLSYPLSAQRKLWSDWVDANSDLSLRWAHTHFVGFVMLRLNYEFDLFIQLFQESNVITSHNFQHIYRKPIYFCCYKFSCFADGMSVRDIYFSRFSSLSIYFHENICFANILKINHSQNLIALQYLFFFLQFFSQYHDPKY